MTDTVRLNTVAEAISAIAAGRPIIVLDSPDRENEGDLIMAAQHATPEWLGFFTRYGSGLICAPMTNERADALRLPRMVSRNQDSLRTDYTVTVDAAVGVTTGISGHDRARTLRVLADPAATPVDLIRPGHILPLRARPAGTLERPGHTEATVDLCRLARCEPVGVIAELVHDDGSMRRAPSCREFADEHGLALIAITDLRAHLMTLDGGQWQPYDGLSDGVTAELPTAYGDFTLYTFTAADGRDHAVLTRGDVTGPEPVLTRVHSECLTGDVFASQRCDCGPQLDSALRAIAEEGRGVVVYVRGHEGRGIGLAAKTAAYRLQENGLDTVDANTSLGYPADARSYGEAAAMLTRLGATRIRLITNNPDKEAALRDAGIEIVERVPSRVGATPHNMAYLKTKVARMGHDIPVETLDSGC